MSDEQKIEELLEESPVFKELMRKSLPLEHFIYTELSRGAADEKTLIEIVKNSGYDVGYAEIMRALMKMEIRGAIVVISTPTGNVVKIPEKKRYLIADED